jgi:hypothetical protein
MLNEHLISTTQATREVPGRPHVSTVWRWINRGVRGVKLETVMVGGRRFTSREAIARFNERITAMGKTCPFAGIAPCAALFNGRTATPSTGAAHAT